MNQTQELSPIAVVTTAAEALARAIRESPEWSAFAQAQQVAEKDAQLSSWLTRHSQLKQTDLYEPTGRTMAELNALRVQIRHNTLYRQQQDTRASLVASLQQVNQTLSVGLGLDFATNAAPRSGCCG